MQNLFIKIEWQNGRGDSTADRECFKGKAVLNLMHTLVDSDLGSSRNLRVREATSAAPFSA